jgi:hypothetical protein
MVAKPVAPNFNMSLGIYYYYVYTILNSSFHTSLLSVVSKDETFLNFIKTPFKYPNIITNPLLQEVLLVSHTLSLMLSCFSPIGKLFAGDECSSYDLPNTSSSNSHSHNFKSLEGRDCTINYPEVKYKFSTHDYDLFKILVSTLAIPIKSYPDCDLFGGGSSENTATAPDDKKKKVDSLEEKEREKQNQRESEILLNAHHSEIYKHEFTRKQLLTLKHTVIDILESVLKFDEIDFANGFVKKRPITGIPRQQLRAWLRRNIVWP